MSERYFIPAIGRDPLVRLTGTEAHHLGHVCRAKPGDAIQLFDGSGYEFEGVVREVHRREVMVEVVARQRVDRELPFHLTLACPAPKGDRVRWLIEKATELGVNRWVPLIMERANPSTRCLRAPRLHRWVIEASKQCGRNTLMELSEPIGWEPYLESESESLFRMVAHPSGSPLGAVLCHKAPGGVALGVGPEGGLADAECTRAWERGWVAASLGRRTLRTETAALAMVAATTAAGAFG